MLQRLTPITKIQAPGLFLASNEFRTLVFKLKSTDSSHWNILLIDCKIYLKLKTKPFMLTMCLLNLRKIGKDEMYVYVFIMYFGII